MSIRSRRIRSLFPISCLTIALCPLPLSAQQLEEIIVTAQRREQSLQEVPVSIEVFSGEQIVNQGINVLGDLAAYSPSLEVRTKVRDTDISIRGMGSGGSNPATEQSAGTFLDGVHLGRGSMVNMAFLDLERVEILRGPQPVHFGMNTSTGAISLVTRTPGPEWEANLSAEVGSGDNKSAEAGIGGPITDTLGVRVAGKWGHSAGYLTDIVTGETFPGRDQKGGRITLQWAPNEAFEATLSAGHQVMTDEGDGTANCQSFSPPNLNEYATFVPGMVPAWDALRHQEPLPDCETEGFVRRGGRKQGDEFPFSPVPGITHTEQRSGFADYTTIWHDEFSSYGLEHGTAAMSHLNAENYRLGLSNEFDNGIVVESTTAYIDFFHEGIDAGTVNAPIQGNISYNLQIFDMFSQELRVRSATGGMIEWEVGAFYQDEDFDYDARNSSSGQRRPLIINKSWQDAKWKNVFAALTFNFMDNKLALDVGARYIRFDKTARLVSTGKTAIYNINPDPDGNGIVVANTGQNITTSVINCATGNPQCGSYGAGFWTQVFGEPRRLPDVWNLQKPVAFGAELTGLRSAEGVAHGPGGTGFFDTYEADALDPQVVLRYSPSEEMSVYLKYAQAVKAGGFDVGGRSAPPTAAQFFPYTEETGKLWEAGVKGTLLDNSLSYGVTLFRQRSHDLQLETNNPAAPTGTTLNTQAGLQETKGIELETVWAASDRLVAVFSGALMDGTLVEFPGAGCSDEEFANAGLNPCYSLAESIAEFGDNRAEGLIDRSGYQSPRTPDYKLTLLLDYWQPLPVENMKWMFKPAVAWSDDYIDDFEGLTQIIKWPNHVDLGFNLGVGDMDDNWSVNLYARNLFGARPEYFREFDPFGTVEVTFNIMSPSMFATYGVQVKYNFN